TRGREQHEIEIAVAVDVGERAAGRMPVGRRDAGRRGDVVEPPVASIAVELAPTLGRGEKDIRPAVAVDIAEADAGALAEDAIGEQRRIAHAVLKANARAPRTHRREARRSALDLEVAPAVASGLVPGRRSGGM